MTKEEKSVLADEIRKSAKLLRVRGYTYRILYSSINCSATTWYNFMRGYNISEQNLITLKQILTKYIKE